MTDVGFLWAATIVALGMVISSSLISAAIAYFSETIRRLDDKADNNLFGPDLYE